MYKITRAPYKPSIHHMTVSSYVSNDFNATFASTFPLSNRQSISLDMFNHYTSIDIATKSHLMADMVNTPQRSEADMLIPLI
jgi:hypothetical protein